MPFLMPGGFVSFDTMLKRGKWPYMCQGGCPGRSLFWKLHYKREDCSLEEDFATEYFKEGSAVGDSYSMKEALKSIKVAVKAPNTNAYVV